VTGTLLLAGGLAVLIPGSEPADDGFGAGGPAEDTLELSLPAAPALDLNRDPADRYVLRTDRRPLATGELGPLFRPDEGLQEMVIKRGQVFYQALAERGVAHEDIMTVVAACKSFRNLTKVRAGELFRVHITPDGGLESLGFDLDEESHVAWVRSGDTYLRQDGTYPVEHRLKGISGSIELSLYASLQDCGAPLALAAKMNDILGWDIDFNRDLRKGDTFRILYDEVRKNGEVIRTGSIKALEIVNRKRVRRAFHFTTDDDKPGYYDSEGQNLQKQLMRAPLEYSRISSGYSHSRMHPVLKRRMPHYGVDYAAPLGTPVRAAGDGVILTSQFKKGNGRYIQIRHTNREYETYYLHLSRYAKGMKPGVRVRQGQIIGYVGASGYATGPHLDYRVKRNGRFVDPRKLKLPAAAPVSADMRPRFDSLRDVMTLALEDLNADRPVPVIPVMAVDPPAWNGADYASVAVPDLLRANP